MTFLFVQGIVPYICNQIVQWYLRSITTNVVSWNPTHAEVYLTQYRVIKFVSDL